MNKPFTFGSVCSGIEAASVAWEPLGWRPAWFAEIEPFPSAVLAHHYPKVANLGDMTQIAMLVRMGFVDAPDALVGGTPCQAFSVAGVRGGLADPRGQLTLAYADLANAIDEKRRERGENECVIYWENVPGVLSSADNAFGCFLGLLAGEDSELTPEAKPADGKNSKYWKWSKEDAKHSCRWPNVGCVYGPERAIAWRVLDAQYFGVAQRRRRVFVIASARKGFNPAAVLFESDGVRRDIAPSRETGKDFTHDVAPCLTSSGRGLSEPATRGGQDPVVAVPARLVSFGEYAVDGTASNCKARDYKDATDLVAYAIQDDTTPKFSAGLNYALRADAGGAGACVAVCVTGNVTHTLKAEGFDASEDGTGRGQPIVAAVANTLTANWAQSGGATSGNNPGVTNPVIYKYGVRRLTPRECERLQGFPDDYTLVPVKGKPAADGPRYKALGNSMAVPCMRWLGVRLMLAYPEMFNVERLAA